jgi:1-acyl-sn-glycerol-3-phosphate acyltransferase
MRFISSILIYLFGAITFSIVGLILLIIILVYPKGIFKLVIPLCNLMIKVFCCRLSYNKRVPSSETFVIMANHCSFLDVFAIPSVFTGKFSAVAASKNFKIPIYSVFLKKMKVVSIDRSNREQAIKGIKRAEKLIKEGYHIVILPEGTRTSNGSLGQFKKGGFHLAINTKARILPIVTKGLFQIKPINRFTIYPGKIKINVGNPIETANKEVDELLLETKTIFKKMLED